MGYREVELLTYLNNYLEYNYKSKTMNKHLELVPVTLFDAALILKWRNDPQTRKFSHNTKIITWEEHLSWMKKTLINKNQKFFIAISNGFPVGSVRAEYSNNIHILSWIVAPEARGKGFGKVMVKTLADQLNGELCAEVKISNLASKKIAEYSGLIFNHISNDTIFYHRPAVETF